MSQEQIWVDLDYLPDDPEFKSIGFLIERAHTRHNSSTYSLRDRPCFTNQSHEPRPLGWAGTNDDYALYGRGIWRVIKTLPNGRCLLERVTKREEIYRYLDENGWPDLISQLVIGGRR